MDKRILVIDDADQTNELEILKFDATRSGINLFCEQFNVGGRLEPTLLEEDGSINFDKTQAKFKSRFKHVKFNLIVCDWELGDPKMDGVELLKRLGNTCHVQDTDRILYSGKLDIKLKEKIKEYTDQKIDLEHLIKYFKGLIVARYYDFVDRNDMQSAVLRYLKEVESFDHIVYEVLMENQDLSFAVGHGHKLEGKSFEYVARNTENDSVMMTDLKRALVKEVMAYLTQRQTYKK